MIADWVDCWLTIEISDCRIEDLTATPDFRLKAEATRRRTPASQQPRPAASSQQPERLQRPVGSNRHRDLRLRKVRREILSLVDEAIRFETVLLVVERSIAAAKREQLGMGAALDDFAVFEHEDLIGAPDRGQPMGDHECRPAGAQRSQ